MRYRGFILTISEMIWPIPEWEFTDADLKEQEPEVELLVAVMERNGWDWGQIAGPPGKILHIHTVKDDGQEDSG